MNKKLLGLLKNGVLSWSSGNGNRSETERAGFKLDVNDYFSEDGKSHIEWIDGGGQDLVETVEGDRATRVFCGQALSDKQLNKLGLLKSNVIKKLKMFVNKLEGNTRQMEDVSSKDGDWEYLYKVLEVVPEVQTFAGSEIIRYKGNLVFAHFHCTSPVE